MAWKMGPGSKWKMTKEAVADAREGDGSYLDGAIERQLEELSTVRTTVEEAIAGVVPEEDDAGNSHDLE